MRRWSTPSTTSTWRVSPEWWADMRAVVILGFGAEPELVDLPVPEPGPDDVLVRVHAAGMNPFDWKISDGALKGVVEHKFPLVMGSDGAGVVEAVGAHV